MLKNTVEKFAHWLLTTDPRSAYHLGHRVYPVLAPQGATKAGADGISTFAVYRRLSTDRDTVDLTGLINTSHVELQVECYADTYVAVREAGNAVFDVLASYTGDAYGSKILSVVQSAESDEVAMPVDGKATPIYALSQTFSIRLTE
jgi:hypothetical protein